MNTDPESIRHAIDGAAVSAIGATLLGWLPAATAILTFIWALIRLYETKTVQRLLGKQ